MNINLLNSFIFRNDLNVDLNKDLDIHKIKNPYIAAILAIKMETEGEYETALDLADHIVKISSDKFSLLASEVVKTFVQVRIDLSEELSEIIENLEQKLINYSKEVLSSENELDKYNYHYLMATFFTVLSTFAFYRSDYQASIKANEEALREWSLIDENDGINLVMIDLIFCKNRTGNFNDSFEISERLLDKVDKENDPLTYCHVLISRGEIMKLKGNYTRGVPIFEEALDLAKSLKNEPLIFHTSRFLADMYSNQGLYERALLLQQDVLSYFQSLDNSHFTSLVLNGLGITSRLTGAHNLAEHYFQQSLSFSEKIGNYDEIITSYYNLLLNEFQKDEKDDDKLKNYSRKIEELIKNVNDPIHLYLPELCDALVLFYDSRLEKRFKAMTKFRKLLLQQDMYYEYRLTCIYHQIDLLLMEFNYTKDEGILIEVNETIDLLLEIGQKMHSVPVMMDYYILQAKFLEKQGTKDEVIPLLKKAHEIAIASNEEELLRYIKQEQHFIENQMREGNQMFNSEISSYEEFGTITKYVQNLRLGKARKLSTFELNPQLIMIISSGGMSLFVKEFKSTILSDASLIASFLSAMMSFSQVAFTNKENIELIKIGSQSLVLQSLGKLFVCFVFKGNSSYALSALNDFVNEVMNREDILEQLNKSTLKNLDKEFLEHILDTIFG